jgi:pyruvate/2-oxoglutarate dehydrogenase complex dihydrolipoamide dehydrogenase (E3) component
MERVRRVRAELALNDSAERFRSLGVDVFLGEGRFSDKRTVVVNGARLRFGRCVIATGSRPSVPDIPGLKEARWFTNETIFSLKDLPKRLLVIGAGATGLELGQAFARLGSKVTIVTSDWWFLGHHASEAEQRIMTDAFRRDGVEVWTALEVARLEPHPDGGTRAHLKRSDPPMEMHIPPWDEPYPLVVDAILVAAGRQPNVEGLDLEAAGVRYDPRHGIVINDFLRTSNRRVFAIGDVCLHGWKLTNAADAQARLAIRNALFPFRRRNSALTIPYCIYTDPEIAHVGPADGRRWKTSGSLVVPLDDPPDTFTVPFTEIDRAATDGATGFLRVYMKKGTDRIVAATVVGPHAGELIGTLAVTISNRVGLGALANTVFAYPTLTEAVRKAADQYNRTRLTPGAKWLIGKWLRWFR